MAGGISEEDIQKVREANDLVSVIGERSPVKQRGRDFWCCCPLHNEKTPSFKIDPALQLWHCFGCGEGGDVFAFVMKTEDLSFPEAVRRLAERAHIEITESGGRPGEGAGRKARLKAVCAEAAEYYHAQLMRNPGPDASAARSYLAGRGLGGEVPKTWQLGFAPGRGSLVRHLAAAGFTAEEMQQANVALVGKGDGKLRDRFYNRVMFPIRDPQGDCIAFGGRVVGAGEPKYLNSQETPLFHKSQVLYGLDKAKAAMAATGTAVVCEGYTDVIALHEAGDAQRGGDARHGAHDAPYPAALAPCPPPHRVFVRRRRGRPARRRQGARLHRRLHDARGRQEPHRAGGRHAARRPRSGRVRGLARRR